ncbi:GDP-mannose 4,6-dehydratase [Methylovorus sp. MP688]|uniref:GDP-mannose 4,6-dehydratase n=1 Tax=Methylovorus sp. (strain MP688) TaxID=887061 RepID=UPI0001EC432A|nr:GDP-mannose 4,6-dehydratase [Methylovorus sp. MP688]ADQ83302.1 dTDP-glucose 4,6-dehydratase [Methylovorus sp. MP688]
MKSALITGVTGQDGSYLAELLISKGYRVIGGVRDIAKAERAINETIRRNVELVEWDVFDQEKIAHVLRKYKPREIYNLTAMSSGSGMYDDPVLISEVNGIAVTRLLEAIKRVDPTMRLCQASSREIFGDPIESPQSESTATIPRSPYGAAKLYADSMIKIYRKHYSIFACSAILFNHESPRRGLGFVTRKISHEAVKIKLGLAKELHLGNLDAKRDWGFANDFVRGMWLMLQQETADDFVLATGEIHTVREFCELAFSHLGLAYQEYVREDIAAFRPNEQSPLVGSAAKARKVLGWVPETGFKELVHKMVDADLHHLTHCINE